MHPRHAYQTLGTWRGRSRLQRHASLVAVEGTRSHRSAVSTPATHSRPRHNRREQKMKFARAAAGAALALALAGEATVLRGSQPIYEGSVNSDAKFAVSAQERNGVGPCAH